MYVDNDKVKFKQVANVDNNISIFNLKIPEVIDLITHVSH